MPISVAALMTTAWIARHFTLPAGHHRYVPLPPDCDLILLPGFCEGELDEVERQVKVAEQNDEDFKALKQAMDRRRSTLQKQLQAIYSNNERYRAI